MLNKCKWKRLRGWCGGTLCLFFTWFPSFFRLLTNPFSTVALERINRALKNSDTSEAKTKEGKKTDDKRRAKRQKHYINRKTTGQKGCSTKTDAGGKCRARQVGRCLQRDQTPRWLKEKVLVGITHAWASWFHWPIKTCQQLWVMREWQGGSSLPLSPLLQCHYLYRIPPPKSCGLGTKGTKTWLINQPRRERDYGYLPINHCGGATYNQTNKTGRRAVIQAMMSPSLSVWVLMLVVGLWICVDVCVCVCEGMSAYVAMGMCACVLGGVWVCGGRSTALLV